MVRVAFSGHYLFSTCSIYLQLRTSQPSCQQGYFSFPQSLLLAKGSQAQPVGCSSEGSRSTQVRAFCPCTAGSVIKGINLVIHGCPRRSWESTSMSFRQAVSVLYSLIAPALQLCLFPHPHFSEQMQMLGLSFDSFQMPTPR